MNIQSQKLALSNMETIVALMPGVVFWKDISGNYLGCNNNLSKILNLPSRFDISGKTDKDILSKDLAAEALEMDHSIIKNDKEVIMQQSRLVSNKLIDFLFKKTPIHNDKGHLIAILGIAYPISNSSNKKYIEDLLTQDIRDIKVIYSEKIPYMTPSQRKCFYYFIQGMSAKDIGIILNLSRRTVESYIETIKVKFNCYKKSELIKKAITFGFLSINTTMFDNI